MRFLADECCHWSVVVALRQAGHDVFSVFETCRGIDDERVIALSIQQGRILITEDKDFGELVYAYQAANVGVLFLRIPTRDRKWLAPAVVRVVTEHGDSLRGRFVIVQPGKVRLGRRL